MEELGRTAFRDGSPSLREGFKRRYLGIIVGEEVSGLLLSSLVTDVSRCQFANPWFIVFFGSIQTS